MRNRQGFSLIELLAAMVIMGIFITAVLAPLTQLFRNTSQSNQTLRVSTQAQEVVEYIRGQWQAYPRLLDASNNDQNLEERLASQNRYDLTCFSLPPVGDLQMAITVYALDRNADSPTALTWSDICSGSAPTNPPPMKRVVVTLTAANNSQSSLTLDIPRP